jgi:hypothetical protein
LSSPDRTGKGLMNEHLRLIIKKKNFQKDFFLI